ncbi:MAG: carboxypeptidase-like regulatory domain-containing protein [Candidatus Roizmanbacteria bacterium]|nr:carboxypeptidase-like regulatory domain-containing protein [Candidatus Roizmanbacteria bacterium]
MKKIFLGLTLLFLIVGLSHPFPAFSQSNVQGEKTVKCLTNRPEDPGNSRSLTWHDPPSPQSIPKYLKGTFLQGSTVYTVACVGSGTGRICGTGSTQYDDELFGANPVGINRGTGQINVTFFHTDNHTTANPKFEVDATQEIKVDATVGGTTASSGGYEFFGVEIRPPASGSAGDAGALQQATFKFEAPSGKDCAVISWTHHDPYGIVFDSVSLEPVANVVVTIRNEAGVALVNNPVLRNNAATREDGVYNYLVPPGRYILTVQPPAGYQFSATPHASPNMAQVYDFIDDNDTKNHCTIYKPNEVIDEKADMPECRNIPLDPVTATPMVKNPINMQYDFQKDIDKGTYTIKGKVSHPLTTVVAYQKITGQGSTPMQKIELGRVDSNHSGFYLLEIPIAKVLTDSAIEVEFIKSTLLGTTPHASLPVDILNTIHDFLFKSVNAQTSSQQTIVIDPLPSYVEGYAYDEAQQAIPNAVVQVKLKNGDSVYYQTKADKNGYFYISPSYLPTAPMNLEFYLNFVKPNGGNVKYRIFEFTQANKYYFTKENINLLTGKKNGEVAVPQAAGKTELNIVPVDGTGSNKTGSQQNKSNSSLNTNASTSNSSQQTTSTMNPVNQQVIIIVALIVVLGIVGAVVAVAIVKKNSSTPPTY